MVRRGAQRRRDLRPRVAVAVLDVRVDDRAVLRHVGDGDVRADRSVHLVVVGERSRVRLRGRLHRRVEARRSPVCAAIAGRGLAGAVRVAHPLPEVPAAGDRRRIRPLHLELRGRLDRVVLLRRDDAEEVADVHDLHVRDVLDRVLVDRDRHRVRAVAVGALAARPDDRGRAACPGSGRSRRTCACRRRSTGCRSAATRAMPTCLYCCDRLRRGLRRRSASSS